MVGLTINKTNAKRAVVGVVGAIALCSGAGLLLSHTAFGGEESVARGQERPRTARVAHLSQAAPAAAHPRVSAPAHVRVHAPLRAPDAPFAPRQFGGLEPAMRPLALGSWINARSVTLAVRMSSPQASARLRPQVEVQPAGTPFTGHPTASGPLLPYTGAPVSGRVTVGGLRDGMSYHWRARVYDVRGVASPWMEPSRVALRVRLAAPAAPALALLTPARPGNWVPSRRLTLGWSVPADASGIRGYSYTLARSRSYAPLLHWRTWRPGVTVQANGAGLWYFSVRALNNAHTWGLPARIPVHIDTAQPRLRVLSAPTGAVNPSRARPLLRLRLTERSSVTVDVLTAKGRLMRSILTSVHGPGYALSMNWDGLDAHGTPAVNGHYLLRITATNRAGTRWSVTRPLRALSVAPAFTGYAFTQPGVNNPYNDGVDGPEQITATLDAPARVHIEAVHDGRVRRAWDLTSVRAGDVITATWDHAAALPSGTYAFTATATDVAGNARAVGLGSIRLDLRHIVVSLKRQKLWALDGNHVLLSSLVTTGGPELPTPTGDFEVIDRDSPFTFHSPFPTSSPFWYADSPTSFALLFQVNGYFIHDAPWRGNFGPGSNVVDGKPGSDTTGTHGCVNMPYDKMRWLYNWATMYTPVQVRQDVSLQ